jgi:hypothetical protein
MFDNGYFHCVKVAESRYLLFLKGFDYGCCPGTLTVFAIDETGVYPVMNKEYDLREFNREPFSMTVADWYDEYVSDDVTINSATYTLFIEDGALKKRWVQLFPNKHEYVDLGLSVNWATCNVGAEKPEEYGDYYAWGETAPYYVKNAGTDNELQWRKGKEAGYDWKSYFDIKTIEPTDYDDIVTFWYYNTQEKKVIEYYHDAATTNWGGEWRMPRQAEFEELINPDNCTWTWTTMNGVNGYRVTSKKPGYEGNSIFLPAAGGYSGTDTWLQDAYGWYWSGSIDDKTSDKSTNSAYILCFYSDTRSVYVNSAVRCDGHPVRPVLPNGRNPKAVYGTDNEPIAVITKREPDVPLDSDEPESIQTMSARFDGSLLESQVAVLSYQDSKVIPQSLPDRMLDSLKKQYPELNTLDGIFDDDGVKTNNKAYKGYLDFIRVSSSVYEFWIAGIEEKGGKAVTIEMGSIDDAITILENLITSYKQGNTIDIGGYSFTGVKGKAYSIPRNDGSDSGPYLVSVKNLKHDLSVLEKRKKLPKVGYDEVGFFTEENKPDQYVLAGRSQSAFISEDDYGVIGGKGADLMIERMIRERAAGTTPGAWGRFNGVILGPLRHHEYMGLSGSHATYARSYIPIIYDPEKYQAPLTDYQRSLKRPVFRRK